MAARRERKRKLPGDAKGGKTVTQLIENWHWNRDRENAALLVAEHELTEAEIAERCHTSEVQLWRWKQVPAFQKRVEEEFEAWRKAVRKKALSIKENRIAALQRNFDRAQKGYDAIGRTCRRT